MALWLDFLILVTSVECSPCEPPGVPCWPRVTANAPLIDGGPDYRAESVETPLPPPSTMQSQLCNEEKSQSLTRKPSKCGVLTMPGTDLIVSPGQEESLKDRSNYSSTINDSRLHPRVVHCFFVSADDESYDGMGPGLTLTLPRIPPQTPAVIEEEIRVN